MSFYEVGFFDIEWLLKKSRIQMWLSRDFDPSVYHFSWLEILQNFSLPLNTAKLESSYIESTDQGSSW